MPEREATLLHPRQFSCSVIADSASISLRGGGEI